MIDRRNSGTTTLHTLLVAGEAVLWWFALERMLEKSGSFKFVPQLPAVSYPVAIIFGIFAAAGSQWHKEINLAALGWTGSLGLAFRQTVAVAGAVFTLAVGLKDPGISRSFLGFYLVSFGLLLVPLNRFQPGFLFGLLYRRDSRMPTLILGEAESFPSLRAWLELQERLGLMPIGLVKYHGVVPDLPGLPIVGDFSDLRTAIVSTGTKQVLMLNLPRSSEDADTVAMVTAACGCRLLIHNNLTTRFAYPLRMMMQDGCSFLAFQDEPLEDPINRFSKRLLDLAISLPVVAFLLPMLIVVVWAVQRIQSPGPVLFIQQRSGREGHSFRILKFRTMRVQDNCGTQQTARDDPRVYPFGKFLRRTSLDEFPQFLNVLFGQMSVVGPRPHYVQHDREFANAINEYRVRFFVKPGITGLAQSRGLRGEIETDDAIRQRIQLDLLYIHNWSFWLDLTIIARTTQQLITPPKGAR